MTLERKIATAFAMTDEVWARHASPWSVWTRVATLPLLVLAFWSRAWIAGWSLVPIAAVLFWTWYNPRAFPAPRSLENWASKGVLGERLFLARREVPIPERHRVTPHLLSAVAGVGGMFLIGGVILLEVWPTLFGMALAYLGKLWFVDRMVWILEDMRDDPRVVGWMTTPVPVASCSTPAASSLTR